MLIVQYVAKTPNPSINTDAGDKAAGAGYVIRYPARLGSALPPEY